LSSEIRSVAERYLVSNRLPYSRILGAVLIDEAHAHFWHSLFKDKLSGRGGLWKVDIERETLPENVIDSGNVFCLLIDPETSECALFYPI
jgi:hypothetical protein